MFETFIENSGFKVLEFKVSWLNVVLYPYLSTNSFYLIMIFITLPQLNVYLRQTRYRSVLISQFSGGYNVPEGICTGGI